MRRADREVSGLGEKLAVIERCKVCRLALVDDGQPYVVPLNFGYACSDDGGPPDDGGLVLYFHGIQEGRKIDIIKKNNRACFEVDGEHKLLEAGDACKYSFAYASVIGFGHIEFIENHEEKIRALNILMKHQTGRDIAHNYTEAQLDAVCVYRMIVEEWTGKQRREK